MAETVFQVLRIPDHGFHLIGPTVELGKDAALAATAIGASPSFINLADGYRLMVGGRPVEMLPATMPENQVEEEAVRLVLKTFKPVGVSRAFFSSGGRVVFERLFHVEVMDPWEALDKYALETDKEICKMLRIPVNKAMNPKKKAGFLRIAAKLKKELGEDLADLHEMHLMGMIEMMGRADLTALTGAEATAFYSTVASWSIPGSAIQARLPQWNAMFKKFGSDIFGGSKISDISNFKLGVNPSLSLLDLSAVDRMANDNVNFVRNSFGARSQAMSMKARDIVREGMSGGLDSLAIGKEIEKQLPSLFAGAGKNYAEVVAQAFVGRARSWSSINVYREAGVVKSQIVAVMDEVTTEFCAMHDGYLISVELSWQKYEQESQLANPEDIKFSSPWVHGRNEQDGSRTLGFYDKGGSWQALYRAPNVGDQFQPLFSEDEFQVIGIGPPPYHGRCRTDIQPVIDVLTDTRTVTQEVDIAPPVPPEPVKPKYDFPIQPSNWMSQARGVPLDRNLYGGNPMNVVNGFQSYMGQLHPGIVNVAKVDASAIGLKQGATGFFRETQLLKDGTLKIGSGDKLWSYMLGHSNTMPTKLDDIFKGVNPLVDRAWDKYAKEDKRALNSFSDLFGARAARSMLEHQGVGVKDAVFDKFLADKNLFGLHESIRSGGYISLLKSSDPSEWKIIGGSAIREWMQFGGGKKFLPDDGVRNSWFKVMMNQVDEKKKDWFDFAGMMRPTDKLRNADFMEAFFKRAGVDLSKYRFNGFTTPMKDLLSDVGSVHFLGAKASWSQADLSAGMTAYLAKRQEVLTGIRALEAKHGRSSAMNMLEKAIHDRTAKVGPAKLEAKIYSAKFDKEHKALTTNAEKAIASSFVDKQLAAIKQVVSQDLVGGAKVTMPFWNMKTGGRGWCGFDGAVHMPLLGRPSLLGGTLPGGERRVLWHEAGHSISFIGKVNEQNMVPFRMMMRDKCGEKPSLTRLYSTKTAKDSAGNKIYEWYHPPKPGVPLFNNYCARCYDVTNPGDVHGKIAGYAQYAIENKPMSYGYLETTSMALQQFRSADTMAELYTKDPDYFATVYTWLMGGYKEAGL